MDSRTSFDRPQQAADRKNNGKHEDAAEPHLQLLGIEPASGRHAYGGTEIQCCPDGKHKRGNRDRFFNEASDKTYDD